MAVRLYGYKYKTCVITAEWLTQKTKKEDK
jgi:hypothetical protein